MPTNGITLGSIETYPTSATPSWIFLQSLKTADVTAKPVWQAEPNIHKIVRQTHMCMQTLTKLVPSFSLPVVPLQILDLALSVLDITILVLWVSGW